MFNITADAGAGTSTAQATEGKETATPKTFLQEDVDRIVQKEKREWEKQASDLKNKAKEYDALQAKMKEKEDAELSELEKLKKRLAELEPLTTQVKEYEESFTELLTKRLEQVPEDKRGLVPDLPPRQKLAWLESAFAAGLFGAQAGISSPPSGMPPQGKPDLLLADAEARIMRIRPDLQKGSPQFNEAVQRALKELKAALPAPN